MGGADGASVAPTSTADDAIEVSKHGIDLTIYGPATPSATVARVCVERGHFQEFYNTRSTYLYYVVSGTGTFFIDGVAHPVGPTDLVTVVPSSTIYYLGAMELVLTVAPAFDERDEHHVRFIDDAETL